MRSLGTYRISWMHFSIENLSLLNQSTSSMFLSKLIQSMSNWLSTSTKSLWVLQFLGRESAKETIFMVLKSATWSTWETTWSLRSVEDPWRSTNSLPTTRTLSWLRWITTILDQASRSIQISQAWPSSRKLPSREELVLNRLHFKDRQEPLKLPSLHDSITVIFILWKENIL